MWLLCNITSFKLQQSYYWILLHLLVPILENRGQAWKQILDGWRHGSHTDDVNDGLERAKDGPQHLGILLTKLSHELLLSTQPHHDGDTRDKVSGLLPDLCRLVIEPPQDGVADLLQVRFDPHAKGVDDGTEPVEHDHVLDSLLLECVQDAVDEYLLEPGVDVGGAKHDLLDGFHDHLAVRLGLVLEVLDDTRDDLGDADLVRQLHGRLYHLAVVAAVERHAPYPEVLEELGQDLLLYVLRLNAVRPRALLHHLEHNLLHLLIGRLELTDQDDHHLLGVIVGVLVVHQRNDIPDGLEERREPLPAVLTDARPERLEYGVERFDTVGGGSFGEGGDGEGGDGANLLLFVLKAVGDGVDEVLEMREHGAAEEDGDLLHNLDTCVARLPRLFGLAHRLEEGQQRRDAQSGGHDREGARRRVTHVLVHVIDVRTHGRDHGRKARSLGKITNDLAAFNAGVIVLVDEEGLDNDENFVHVGTDEVVELIEDAVDDLDEQVAFLVLERRRHEQRQNLVEERARPKVARLVRDLAQSGLAHGRRAVLDLEEEAHNLALLEFLDRHLPLVLILQQFAEMLHVLLLEEWKVPDTGNLGGQIVCLLAVLLLHHEPHRVAHGGRCRHELAGRRPNGDVGGGRFQDLVAGGGEHGVELLVRHGPVAGVELALPPHRIHRLGRHGHRGRRY
ncbi:LOW QUALITY PROTEIN: hypothetical protein BC936DRAFT_139884 [Jimgerdemannia flammicorona]|uniref:Uncharacterized protein n=1 Tax=Jimgerdemannia flammicorona TaxID=994334 RepID=A0A433DHB9_9FUNG|nr:LOW QUALITY PROTEIN: hypothetical protein BC936DRAFT_139884 [Jimgerdemannia flammicorona]